MQNSYGTLLVRAYTAGGALPVEGATVRILGTDEYSRSTSFSAITDRDGVAEGFKLPAPSPGYSMSPSPDEIPYSTYDLEISKDGYYTQRIQGLTVFPGINSVQLINMIPGSGNMVEDYPRGSINYIITQNSDL